MPQVSSDTNVTHCCFSLFTHSILHFLDVCFVGLGQEIGTFFGIYVNRYRISMYLISPLIQLLTNCSH